jgi:hypothetical protein
MFKLFTAIHITITGLYSILRWPQTKLQTDFTPEQNKVLLFAVCPKCTWKLRPWLKCPHITDTISGSLYNCIHYGVFRAYCWIYQKLKHIERNLSYTESGCNGNLFLAKNFYSSDDLGSRESNLQVPV